MEIPNTDSEMESSNQFNIKFIGCFSHFWECTGSSAKLKEFLSNRGTTEASHTPSATGGEKQVVEV